MPFCTNYLFFFCLISSAYRPGAFNGTTNYHFDDDFYPIEKIDQVQISFNTGVHTKPGSWIRNYTVVLETKDGRRTFIPEYPQQKVYADNLFPMKAVPEAAV